MNSKTNTKKWLTASILWAIFLAFPICSLHAQQVEVWMLFKGDTITDDTVVVMKLSKYRDLRERLALLQAKDSLSVEIDSNAESIILSIQASNDHLLQVIDELYVMLNRREVVIDNLTYSIRKLEAINTESIDNFEAYTNTQKKAWKNPVTIGALAVGLVIGIIIAK